jgi:hypothetical protein
MYMNFIFAELKKAAQLNCLNKNIYHDNSLIFVYSEVIYTQIIFKEQSCLLPLFSFFYFCFLFKSFMIINWNFL